MFLSTQSTLHCLQISDCGLAAYRASENSPLTPYVNLFILRFLENGIYDKQLEWMKNLNEAVFQVKRREPPSKENVVLTVEMTFAVFLVYSMGIGIAVLSFVIEIGFDYVYTLVFGGKKTSEQ